MAVLLARAALPLRRKLAMSAAAWAMACAAPAPPASKPAAADSADASFDVGGSEAFAPEASPDAPSPDAGPPPQPLWRDETPWQPPQAVPCPATLAADGPLPKLLDAIGAKPPVSIQKSLIEKFGGNIASDPQRLPHFHTVQENFHAMGACWSGNLAKAADAAVQSDHPMTSLLAVAVDALGRKVTVGGALPQPNDTQPLVQALQDLHDAAGEPFDAQSAAEQAAAVPAKVQKVAAKIILAATIAASYRNAWLDAVGSPTRQKAWYNLGAGMLISVTGGGIDPDLKNDSAIFLLDQRTDQLFRGALVLLQALDEGELLAAKTAQPFSFAVSTPLGRVVLKGGGNDTWSPKDAELKGDLLLALDCGGNDTWQIRAGANTSHLNPVAVAIDLGGDDQYGYLPAPDPQPFAGVLPPDEDSRTVAQAGYAPLSLSTQSRQGAGRLGIGVLVDLGGGKDSYTALRMSQGYANFGVGILWDDGGDDTYLGEAAVQASAAVGIAISYDGGGNDTRTAVHLSQGLAWIASGALLYDRGGNDTYACKVDKPLQYPSPQTPDSANASLCQGTGFGLRRDNTKTHRSGGLALLRDLTGNDSYEGSTFVQGTGYWFGTGILADGGGDDQYDGLFYAQGAAAHFALGFFLDGGGNDDHGLRREPLHSQMGLGHDFSSALFVDESGDDIYHGPSRSQGASKCHGHGLFVDNGGSDSYSASGDDKAIGWATDYDWAPGVCGNYVTVASRGFFVDVGGKDSYSKPGKQLPKSGSYGNDSLWVTDDPDEPKALELSGGIDTATGDSGVHVP